MADRELLLERLERLAIVLDELMPRCAELVREALALLKEQEAVKPFFDEYMNPRCGKCRRRLFCVDDRDSFCSKCGQAVKWND